VLSRKTTVWLDSVSNNSPNFSIRAEEDGAVLAQIAAVAPIRNKGVLIGLNVNAWSPSRSTLTCVSHCSTAPIRSNITTSLSNEQHLHRGGFSTRVCPYRTRS